MPIAPSEIEARAQGAARRMIRRATQALPGDRGHMRVLPIGFNSGVTGTALTADVPAEGTPVDFYGRITGVYADEMSTPAKISGIALFTLWIQPVGETDWIDLTNAGLTIGFTGDVSGGTSNVRGWWRHVRPGDHLAAKPATIATVQSVTVRFAIRELPYRVMPYAPVLDVDGNPVLDSGGNPVVIMR
jgi:hypothetical protein